MQAFRRWMVCVGLLILGMVFMGGMTRLTGSGLSIVSWKPVMGALPPLTVEDWRVLFEQYQTSPEFHKVNGFFTLSDFKRIFWWEYIHRLWGRLMGVAMLAPVYLAFRTPLPFYSAANLGTRCQLYDRLSVILLLVGGALQGGVGWWMVKSGLNNNPWVSPYRLGFHLGVGLGLYTLCLQAALRHGFLRSLAVVTWGKTPIYGFLSLLSLTLFWGALVAGNHAGLIYNTFPLMAGGWTPSDEPFALKALFETPAWIQWTHRLLALLTVTWGIGLGWVGYQRTRHAGFIVLSVGITLQAVLGVATLLYHIPPLLGVMHQLGAFGVWTVGFSLGYRPTFSYPRPVVTTEGRVYA